MEIYNIIFGLVLLAFGRRLFWLVIGIAGFLFGMEMTGMFFGEQPHWLQLALAVGLGCVGTLLAMIAQRLAFTLGGFFAGLFLAFKAGSFLAAPTSITLLLIIAAGVIGAVAATLLMDQAITILACLVGAGAIIGELSLAPPLNFAIFGILAGAGFLIQEKLLPLPKENRPRR